MTDFAFVFPGQGSQSVGMLSEVYDSYEIVRDTFREASYVLGYDLYELVSKGPAEELGKTFKTQPALLTSSVALYRLWCSKTDLRPKMMAGHSLGEYSALVCAGAVEIKDAVNLVKLRGEYMQEAVPEGAGAMAAVIGLEDAAVVRACAEAAQGEVSSAVNFNSPGQVVIDVGINVDEKGNLCGDVAFEEACGKAAAITPVPGGVGTMTSTVLCLHVIEAAEKTL